jgi:hypothetical protein
VGQDKAGVAPEEEELEGAQAGMETVILPYESVRMGDRSSKIREVPADRVEAVENSGRVGAATSIPEADRMVRADPEYREAASLHPKEGVDETPVQS